jgi:3-oxoadipate enol-lactonase/4-carboxymuconolactone decarboxylase
MTDAAVGRLVGPPGERQLVVERGVVSSAQPSILLVHGFPSNLVAWARVLERLPHDRHVIAVDLLGLGRSERNVAASHAPSAHAARLGGLLDDLGVARLTAAGLSYGGAVVQWLAASDPGRVTRLVLVASIDASRPADLAHLWRLQALAMMAGLSVPPLARAVLAAGLRREVMEPATVTAALVDAYLAPLLRRGTKRSLWAYGRDAAGERPLDLERIAAPTSILAGTADGIVPIATARRLAVAIPSASLTEIQGGRHLLAWERPEAIAVAITGE